MGRTRLGERLQRDLARHHRLSVATKPAQRQRRRTSRREHVGSPHVQTAAGARHDQHPSAIGSLTPRPVNVRVSNRHPASPSTEGTRPAWPSAKASRHGAAKTAAEPPRTEPVAAVGPGMPSRRKRVGTNAADFLAQAPHRRAVIPAPWSGAASRTSDGTTRRRRRQTWCVLRAPNRSFPYDLPVEMPGDRGLTGYAHRHVGATRGVREMFDR